MNNEQPGYCEKCKALLDPDEWMCCTCIDDTVGRNQHFWQIRNEREKGEENEKLYLFFYFTYSIHSGII